MTENVIPFDENDQSALDWKIAIALGLDMTQTATAELLGVARQTVNIHISENQTFFDILVPFIKTLDATRVSKNVTLVAEKAETRIKRMFDRSFVITEKLIAKAEALGDEITIEQAMEIHQKITVWASKFTASEAPKRFDGSVTHTEIHTLDENTIKRLDSFMSKHNRLFAQQVPEIKGDVIDAQLVSE